MTRSPRRVTTPATRALEAAGVDFTLRPYEHDPAVVDFGREAAAALGVEPDRVFKTLFAVVDGGRLVVGVVPVSRRLDLTSLAGAAGGRRAAMADPRDAERRTGYVVGGISPFGQRMPHPTVVDESALLNDTVLVSGGRRGLDLELAPAELVRAASAIVAALAH